MPAARLIAFVCKVSYELATGDTIFVKSLGSGMVGVPLAHVAGAAVGFLVGLGTPATRRLVPMSLQTALALQRFEPPVLDRIAAARGGSALTTRSSCMPTHRAATATLARWSAGENRRA